MSQIRNIIALFFILSLAIVLPSLGRAQEQPPNQAGLVIQHGDGRVVTACVSFGEPEISGQDLLDRAGISYIAQGDGGSAAVCKLDGEGCDYPAEDCFCKCRGAECVYWAYQSLRDGKWSYAQLGASALRVKPGDVQGWAWGAGSVQAGAQPPVLSLDQICAAPAAQPTVAPQPTHATPPPPEPPAPIQPSQEAPAPAAPTEQPTRAAPAPSPAVTSAATTPPTEAPTRAPTAEQPTAPPATSAAAPPTAPPAASAAPTATFEAAGAAAPTPTAPARDGSPAGYLAFAAIALVLLSGIAAALLRRRPRGINNS